MRVMLRTKENNEWKHGKDDASEKVKDKSTHMVSGSKVTGSVFTHLCPPLSATPSATLASAPASMTSDQASSLSKEPTVSLLPPL